MALECAVREATQQGRLPGTGASEDDAFQSQLRVDTIVACAVSHRLLWRSPPPPRLFGVVRGGGPHVLFT
jgi:hypothetical protein